MATIGTGLIHIHEDDWGMRSLHPAAAWQEVAADLEKAVESGERHRAPDGVGWTALHVIADPAIDFAGIGLQVEVLARDLAAIMPRVPRFVATASAGFDPATHDAYGTYEKDAWCFGHGADCFIKLEPRDGLVRSIWFEARTNDPQRLADLRRAIEAVDRAAPAMIADYWADAAGLVRDTAFFDRYFNWLADST